ncbi:MAG: post-translocation molecular chaperone, partial [Chloroflexota bacterium]
MLYWGMGIAAALCVVILAGFATWEYLIKPNQTLAQVDGTEIKRKDYWKVRAFELLQQAELFRAQNPMFAAQLRDEARRVWGSTSVEEATLSRMIDDQVILKHIGELNLTVTDQDVRDYIDQQFEPANAPIYTPTPTPTLIPTRAAWATETAQAELAALTATARAEASPVEGTPEG